MSLEFAHGAIQWLAADAASTVYTVSGLSFQPKALRFYWVGLQSATDAASQAVSERRGVGLAASTSDRRCVGTFSSDTAGTSDCGSFAANDCVVGTVDGTGARDGELDLNSITSDGFTLIVDDQGVANITVFWEAWGGDDITVATTGDIAEPAATGNVDYTVTGFVASATDQVVMLAGVQSTAAVNTGAAADSGLHVGFATASGNITVCGNSDDASTAMDTDGYCQTGECLSMIVLAGGNPNARAALTQFGTNNFRLNWTARGTTNRRSIFLAIKGGNWLVSSLTLDANGLGNSSGTGGSFAIKGMSLIGRMTTQNTAGTATANDRIGLGSGSSDTSRRAMGILDEDATASSACEIDTVLEYDSVLAYPSTGGALQSAYDIQSISGSNFSLVVDVAGGVASEWIGFMVFGDGTRVADLNKTLGAATTSAAGSVSVNGALNKSLGAATLSAAGAVTVSAALDKTLGAVTLSSTVTTSEERTADLSVTFGGITFSSAGVVTISAALDKTLGALTVSAAASATVSAALDKTLGSLALSASGAVSVTADFGKTLDALTLASAGVVAVNAALAATLGNVTLTADGTVTQVSSADLNVTLGSLTLLADGTNANQPEPEVITPVTGSSGQYFVRGKRKPSFIGITDTVTRIEVTGRALIQEAGADVLTAHGRVVDSPEQIVAARRARAKLVLLLAA